MASNGRLVALALVLLAMGSADAKRYDKQIGGSITVMGSESTVSIADCDVTSIDIQSLASGATVTITNTNTTEGVLFPALVAVSVVISDSTISSAGGLGLGFSGVDAQSKVTVSASVITASCDNRKRSCLRHTSAIAFAGAMSGAVSISDRSTVAAIDHTDFYSNAIYFPESVSGAITISDSSISATKTSGSRSYGLYFVDLMTGQLSLSSVALNTHGNTYSAAARFNRDVSNSAISIADSTATTTGTNSVVLFLKTVVASSVSVTNSVFNSTGAGLVSGVDFVRGVTRSDVSVIGLRIRKPVPTQTLGLAVTWTDSNITVCNIEPDTFSQPTLTRSVLRRCEPTTATPTTATPATTTVVPSPIATTTTAAPPASSGAAAGGGDEGDSDTGLLVGLIIAGLLLLLLCCCFIIVCLKKRKLAFRNTDIPFFSDGKKYTKGFAVTGDEDLEKMTALRTNTDETGGQSMLNFGQQQAAPQSLTAPLRGIETEDL
jgi:hypothetical protein